MPWYSVFSFFIFCLEAMRTTSVTVMVINSKVLLWKLLDFSYVQRSFSTITGHIDNGTWKIFCSWRFYGHRSTYKWILFWVKMKWKWVKVPWKLSVAQKSEPILWRTLHQDISLIIVLCFASQTKLVFKFNLILNE